MADAQSAAQNWASRLGQSGDKIKAGVQGVTTAPGLTAARQKDVWAANVAAAKDKWATRVAGVSLPEWQSAMIDKGLNRIASGATAAQPKFAEFMTQLLPHIERGRSNLAPRGNLEQNIGRMVAFSRHMATFKRS